MTKAAKQRALLLGAIFASVLISAPAFAQNLGDAGRHERERQQHLPHTHVYTNDDLKRAQILVPADRARALAAQNSWNEAIEARADVYMPLPLRRNSLAVPQPIVTLPAFAPFGELTPDPSDRNIRIPLRSPVKKHSSVPPTPEIRKPKNPEPKKNDFVLSDIQKKRSNPPPPEPKLNMDSSSNGVRVAPGDSLWKIAQRVLGNGARWKQLAAANPQISDPNLIRTGQWIRIAAGTFNTKEIVVREGDTLSSVAQAELGDAHAFNCIAQANPQLRDADMIFPGETLVVPESCGADR
jgi:nucleoid-associated protein YgaU